MTMPVDLAKLIPAEKITGEDDVDTGLLKKMLQDARAYIEGFSWCPPIDGVYLGCGVGGVVAVFLFHFSERINGTDEWLWVVEGDLPSAYLVPDQAGDPASAISIYCELMDKWAIAILEGHPLYDVFPVRAEPTPENAKNLQNRLDFIRNRLLPDWRQWFTAKRVEIDKE